MSDLYMVYSEIYPYLFTVYTERYEAEYACELENTNMPNRQFPFKVVTVEQYMELEFEARQRYDI